MFFEIQFMEEEYMLLNILYIVFLNFNKKTPINYHLPIIDYQFQKLFVINQNPAIIVGIMTSKSICKGLNGHT